MFNNQKVFTSGWDFDRSSLDLRSKFQMINVALILASIGLIFGIMGNVYKETYGIIPLEIFIIMTNIVLFFVLRKCRRSFKIVSFIVSVQFTFFFLYLYYIYPPESLKFIWLFTYPIILLYFQDKKYAQYWMFVVVFFILIGPIQSFIEMQFTQFQAIYLAFVLIIVDAIITFYQNKMNEAKDLIFEQQQQLQVQVDELVNKDKLLSIQSKQAVMGEMISMIAHQWRQPLSSVTLTISDIQLKKMLGKRVDEKVMEETLQSISDTVVYLSETIDDFQTYFEPNKELSRVNIDEIVQKAVNFVKPRLKGSRIDVRVNSIDIEIETYINELIQVILNILNNAIDELLKLNKESLILEIRLEVLQESIKLSIIDNANGIKSDTLESIFEPYYSTKGKNGTGLGLYMSQMIMQKQFNSLIEVQSSKEGSIFTLEIPKKLS